MPLPCLVPHVALEDLWARPKDLQAPGELKVHQAVLKALAVPGGPEGPGIGCGTGIVCCFFCFRMCLDPRKVPLETPCRYCPRMSFMQKGFHQRNEKEIPTQGTIQWCSVLFRANSFCSLLFPSHPGLNTSQQIQLIYSQLGLTS